MGSCSSPDLEPGPLEELKPDAIVTDPFVPFAEKHATEFAERTGGFLHVLDAAYVALEVEQTLDLLGDVGDVAGGFASVTAAAVNPEALAQLQAAEDGFRVARDKTASLLAWLPPDVQQPGVVVSFFITVRDAAGAGVPGALVTIDADFGNGTQRVTDAAGRVNFGLPQVGAIAYTVDAAGYRRATGTIALGVGFGFYVTLEAA